MSTPDPRPQDAPDYVRTYQDFWREIVESPDGTLNRDQIMRELSDYHAVMHEVSKVYDEVTGRISKPNTAAFHVIAEVEERTQEAIKEARKEWFAELFGTPEEIAAREAEAADRPLDDPIELCERIRPGEHERRVRERVAAGLRKDAEDARRTLAVFEPQARDTRVLARAATLDEIADRLSRGESR